MPASLACIFTLTRSTGVTTSEPTAPLAIAAKISPVVPRSADSSDALHASYTKKTTPLIAACPAIVELTPP